MMNEHVNDGCLRQGHLHVLLPQGDFTATDESACAYDSCLVSAKVVVLTMTVTNETDNRLAELCHHRS